MEIVNDLDADQVGYWSELEGEVRRFAAPPGMENCDPAMAVVTDLGGTPVVRVAWRPSLADVEALADGGVVWLSSWGGLPPHMLEVQAAARPVGGPDDGADQHVSTPNADEIEGELFVAGVEAHLNVESWQMAATRGYNLDDGGPGEVQILTELRGRWNKSEDRTPVAFAMSPWDMTQFIQSMLPPLAVAMTAIQQDAATLLVPLTHEMWVEGSEVERAAAALIGEELTAAGWVFDADDPAAPTGQAMVHAPPALFHAARRAAFDRLGIGYSMVPLQSWEIIMAGRAEGADGG